MRFEAARTRARAVEARTQAAAAHHAAADGLAAEAAAARTDSFRLFDAGEDGEPRWADARRLAAEAHARYGDAVAELEAAFLLDGAAARDRMASVLWSRAELAEAEHDRARVDELVRSLATYDPARAATWQRPGRLVVELDRAARISLHGRLPEPGTGTGPDPRSDPARGPSRGPERLAGGFSAHPLLERTGARFDEELPAGSYLAVIALPDGFTVRDPVLLGRGERLTRRLSLPTRADAPPGFVYIPGGRFLFGSTMEDAPRREFLETQPMHAVQGGSFWMSRTEVPYADWMAYLRDARPEELLARSPANGVALEERGGRFHLTIEPTTNQRHSAAEGEPLVYPGRKVRREVHWERLPVSGVSYLQVVAYTAWLDRTGRVPGARVCTVHEWEHAARGADGRPFPHGDTLVPAEANLDLTYGREPDAFGPDEVGSYPATDSPYGISDLSGNLWELTAAGVKGKPWYRGGSFYHPTVSARSDNANTAAEPNQRNIRIGLRLCADAARAR